MFGGNHIGFSQKRYRLTDRAATGLEFGGERAFGWQEGPGRNGAAFDATSQLVGDGAVAGLSVVRGGHLLTVPGTCLTKCQPRDPFRHVDNSSSCRYVSICAARVTARVRGGRVGPGRTGSAASCRTGCGSRAQVGSAIPDPSVSDGAPCLHPGRWLAISFHGWPPAPPTSGGAMSGSHRRRGWFSSWWSRPRTPIRPASSNAPSRPRPASVPPSPWWSVGPTREVPVLPYAPLMTLAQATRGNGGRCPR